MNSRGHVGRRLPGLLFPLALAALQLTACGGGTGAAAPPLSPPPAAATVLGGYTDLPSYAPGDTVRVFANTVETGYRSLAVTDLAGNPRFTFEGDVKPQTPMGTQPWQDGFGYAVSAAAVLPNLPSGFYLVGGTIPLIVRNSGDAAAVTIVYPTNTINAYNPAGGRNLYSGPTGYVDRATQVSRLRPVPSGIDPHSEGCLRWAALQGYDTQYISDVDLEDYARIARTRVLVVAGHSEYWTRQARKNFDRFVAAGGNAVILSGNTMWWQARLSADRQTLVVYRDATLDPIQDASLKTILWTDPSLAYPIIPSIGADFYHGGYGTRGGLSLGGYRVAQPGSPVFAGTGLEKGQVLAVPTDEYDGAPLAGFDATGYPVLDRVALRFAHTDLLGFDYGFRSFATYGTMMALRKTSTSGLMFNAGSMNWCDTRPPYGGVGASPLWQVTRNMVDAALKGQYPFAD